MGIYLNPDNDMFKKALNSEIYVDKTGMLSVTNQLLDTENRFLAVSRPRRFGKSMALNMLCAYYSRGCDSRALFHGYEMEKHESFEKHLNKYNVIELNMSRLLDKADTIGGVIQKFSARLEHEMKKEFPDVVWYEDSDLEERLNDIYDQTKVPFVFLIDEWDAVFRVKKWGTEAQKEYLDFLRTLLKDQPYVALAYMTGILPIKKYGEHSALNMFTEYSMTNQRELARYTGFTEAEVQKLCEQYEMPYDETKRWYDGYLVRGMEIYNPRSVVMSMTGHDYDSYWTKTETYEALKVYIEMDFDGLREKVIRMIAGEHIPINTEKFTNDMTTFASADDVLTLLIHLGYLTYDFAKKEVYIPNSEVGQEFINSIEDKGWEEVMTAIHSSDELLSVTINGEATKVAEILEKIHQNETSIMAYNDENALASVIFLAYYSARRKYEIYREFPAGKGFADLVFVPRRNVTEPAMVVELKVDKTAQTAIDQIKEKQYPKGLKGYEGEILLVGISYDKKEKKHSCVIEKHRRD